MQACLLDFILRHNLLVCDTSIFHLILVESTSQVGTFNSTGQHYRGHFDIWLTNNLQEMTVLTKECIPDSQLLAGWVNGNLYVPTTEVFGILAVPPDIRNQCGMQEFNELLDSKQPHHFLASKQGTRKPILPIHSSEEQRLFSKFMREDANFSGGGNGPVWQRAVKIWNRYADEHVGISYKVYPTITFLMFFDNLFFTVD
jgi:hypothetical protein